MLSTARAGGGDSPREGRGLQHVIENTQTTVVTVRNITVGAFLW